jgi:hypothetical protein
MLDEDRVPALGFADGFPGHEEKDADDDNVGDEEEDVTGSTELVAGVDFGVTGPAPGAAEDVGNESSEEEDVDGTDGPQIAIETPIGVLPCSDPEKSASILEHFASGEICHLRIKAKAAIRRG